MLRSSSAPTSSCSHNLETLNNNEPTTIKTQRNDSATLKLFDANPHGEPVVFLSLAFLQREREIKRENEEEQREQSSLPL